MITLLSPVFLAIYLPYSSGAEYFTSYPSLIPSLAIPVILVGLLVPDSFAGELERHTLPTLLATRLPERSIVLGKLLVTGAIAWGFALGGLLLSAVVVLLTADNLDTNFYKFEVLFADIVVSLAVVAFASTTGIFVSLRSKTAQDASQMLVMIFMTPPMIGGFIVISLLSGSGSDTKDTVTDVMDFIGSLGGQAAIAAVIFVAAGLMYRVSMRRFSRERLSI